MNHTIAKCDWYEKAAEAIVRQGRTLFQYCNEAKLGITSREAENIARTKEFQACLRVERNKVYKELSTDPTRSRTTAVGQLLFAIQKLLENEQYDKAVTALTNLFKIEGWTNDQASINIFNDLNAKDIDALKRKIQEKNEVTRD